MDVYLILFVTGIVVGMMNAIAGGGGLVAFPVLLAVGLPAIVADATSFLVTIFGQISSAFGYRKYLKKLPKTFLWLIIPCAVGAYIGSELLKQTSSTNFDKLVPFLILLTVIIFGLQPLLNSHLIKHLRARRRSYFTFGLLALSLLAMSIYGGYFGVGLGFAVLSILGFMRIHELHTLVGMKNVASIVVAAVVIINILNANLISWHHGLTMAAGTLIGGYAGAHLAQKVPSKVIRVAVVIIGLGCAGYLYWLYR